MAMRQQTRTYNLPHDDAGNLTYDGTYQYTYDAWNRLIETHKAYRVSSDDGFGGVELGPVQTASRVMHARYDGINRRIVRKVENSADLDATYHYYHHGHSTIEVRNGSDLVLKQHLWGLDYIDELVQTSINSDPFTSDEPDAHHWSLHNANYNVMALVDATGAIVERYEYTPYGQRQVYFSPGVNDPLAMAPTSMSRRWHVADVAQPYGLNSIGHQGLRHDPETGLVYNRARMLHVSLGRFVQRDPINQNQPGGGYQDGMSLYQ